MNIDLPDIAFVTLLAAVILGSYLVVIGIRHKKRNPDMGFTHASFAIAAIAILALTIMEGPSSKLINASVFFLLLALIGGVLVFLLHEEKKPPAMAAVTAHAIMGMIGFILLLLNVIG